MVECSKYWLFYFYLGPLVLCLPGGLCRNASSPNPTLSLSPRFTVFHCGHVNTWHGQLHHVDPVDPQPHKKLPEVCELKGNILQRPTWSVFRSVWVWVPFCHCDIQHIIDLSLSLSLSMYIYIYLPHTSPYYFWGHRSWLFPPCPAASPSNWNFTKGSWPSASGIGPLRVSRMKVKPLVALGIQT